MKILSLLWLSLYPTLIFAQNDSIVYRTFKVGYNSQYADSALKDSISGGIQSAAGGYYQCYPKSFRYIELKEQKMFDCKRISSLKEEVVIEQWFGNDTVYIERSEISMKRRAKELHRYFSKLSKEKPNIFGSWKVVSYGVDTSNRKSMNKASLWAVGATKDKKIFVRILFGEMPVLRDEYFFKTYCIVIKNEAAPRYEKLALELIDCFR